MINLEKFSHDMFMHRRHNLKVSLKVAQEQSGLHAMTIRDIENEAMSSPSIHTYCKACKWMGKDITAYIN
jgi:hypothetical protein